MTVRVKKANTELRVSDADLQTYLDNGYSAIDDKGNVIKPPTQTEVERLLSENAALKAENAALKRTAGDEGEFICEFCGKNYKRGGDLLSHIKKEHGPDQS